jgi:hypothetical protein
MRLHSVLAIALPLLVLGFGGPGWGAGTPKPGAVTRAQLKSWKRTGEVTDLANILDEAVEAKLRDQAREVRAKSGVDLAVATLPGLPSGDRGKDLAALARRWGVGGRDKGLGNTGVLLALMPRDDHWVLLWGYPGKGSGVVFAAERGRRPGFVGTPGLQPPVKSLLDEFRVLAQLYAAYYGFALAPSAPWPGLVALPAAERTAAIDDPVNLLDAQARARLEGTLDEVRRNTGAVWIIKTVAGPAEATGRAAFDPQELAAEVGWKTRLKAPRSGDLLVALRASDGAGGFVAGGALQDALRAEPSALDPLPLYEREFNKVAPFRTLDLSLRDLARRFAATGGWALSPRWTPDAGLPPLRPDASIQWKPPAAPTPVAPPAAERGDFGQAGTAGDSTANAQRRGSVDSLSLIQASRAGRLMIAYSPLMALLWFWLTLRAFVTDRRGAWGRLFVLCVLGSPCGMPLISLFSAGVFISMRDKFHTGIAAFIGCMGGAMLGFLVVEGVANPTFKDRRRRSRSYFAIREPSLPLRWHHPGLMLCRWGLGGVALGCLVLSVAFAFMRDPVRTLDVGGLLPTYAATGLAVAAALVGLGKVAAHERGRAR